MTIDWKAFLVNYAASIAGLFLSVILSIYDAASGEPLISNRQAIIAFSTIILIQISISFNKLSEPVDDILSFTNNYSVTKPVNESDFYKEFKQDVEDANHRVLITYFNNQNPLESNNSDTEHYYRNMDRLVGEKERENVEFRRIVRGVPQLEDWIDHLLNEHEGRGNYSLACTLDDEPEAALKSHVAVQLIDDDITYFVAVGEQQEYSDPRDMYVRSEELNTQWERYYDRIWEDSLLLIERGDVIQQNVNEYKSHIDDFQG